MKLNSLPLYVAVILASSACVQQLHEGGVAESAEEQVLIRQKVRNKIELAVKDEINVQLTSSEDFDFSSIEGVISAEKLFVSHPGREAIEKEFGMDRWYTLKLDKACSLEKVAADIASFERVECVEYCTKLHHYSEGGVKPLNVVPAAAAANWTSFNDPLVGAQWHYHNTGDLSISSACKAGADINVKDAWRLTTGDPSIVVAVLDFGVYYDHPDLKDNIWTNSSEIPGNGIDDDGNGYVDDVHGWNFRDNSKDITWSGSVEAGHGTHIAGTIAARNGNGIGVCGIAGGDANTPGVKIMSCQVFSASGAGVVGLDRAFKYAADNGASIAQCSFGWKAGDYISDQHFANSNPSLVAAINYFLATSNCPALDGGVAIYASGNDSMGMSAYPGAYYKNISVSAVGCDNLPAQYTNYGPSVNIAAPGGEYATGNRIQEASCILSTLPLESASSGYGYMQGTSMACPHVTGVAALGLSYLLKKGVKISNQEFMSKMLTATNDIDDYLIGTKVLADGSVLNLPDYRKKMGTGTIDTWKFLMQLDGTPSICVVAGKSQRVDLSDYFGGGSHNLTYLSVEISSEDSKALGLVEAPSMSHGKLKIYPGTTGCGKITIRAVAGGETLGDGGNSMGGIELVREISIISRNVSASNGAWL